MPLDPVAQVLMEALDQTFPRIAETGMTAAEAREVLNANLRAAALEPQPIGRVENRTIPGPAGEIPVRVYWPLEGNAGPGPLPVIAYYHGGGFAICNLDSHDESCRGLSNGAGCIVVSVDYGLAPEHKFPAPVEDCYAATSWLAEHAGELGGDPARLAVAGDSAGGNFAAVVPLMARDRGGPPIAFQLLVYPVTDFSFDTPSYRDNAEGYFLTRKQMEWYWAQYLPDDSAGADPYASPLRAPDLSGLPPALVITAEFDPLRDEGEAYGRRLQDAGVPTTVTRYDGVFHGFFGFGAMLEPAKRANEEAYAALRAALSTT
jgi:acetyl esterase